MTPLGPTCRTGSAVSPGFRWDTALGSRPSSPWSFPFLPSPQPRADSSLSSEATQYL